LTLNIASPSGSALVSPKDLVVAPIPSGTVLILPTELTLAPGDSLTGTATGGTGLAFDFCVNGFEQYV
jgi:hypothetical protein